MDRSVTARDDFDAVVRDNEERLLRYLIEMTGSREDSRDILQGTLLKAWNVFKSGSRPDHPRAWLYRISHNEAANFLRGRRIRREVHQTVILQVPPADSDPPDRQLMEDAYRAAQALPDPFREAIALHYFHGLSLSETAGVLGCPVGTAKTLVARGLRALRKKLGARLDVREDST